MSERAYIARELHDGSVEYSYVHSGSLSQAGKTLRQHYAKPEKAQKLVALGAISVIGRKLNGPKPTMAISDYLLSELAGEVTYAWLRDSVLKNDKEAVADLQTRNYPSFQELTAQVDYDHANNGPMHDIEHLYCYGEGGWLYYARHSNQPLPLSLALDLDGILINQDLKSSA